MCKRYPNYIAFAAQWLCLFFFQCLGNVVGKSSELSGQNTNKNNIARYQATVVGTWKLIGFMFRQINH